MRKEERFIYGYKILFFSLHSLWFQFSFLLFASYVYLASLWRGIECRKINIASIFGHQNKYFVVDNFFFESNQIRDNKKVAETPTLSSFPILSLSPSPSIYFLFLSMFPEKLSASVSTQKRDKEADAEFIHPISTEKEEKDELFKRFLLQIRRETLNITYKRNEWKNRRIDIEKENIFWKAKF